MATPVRHITVDKEGKPEVHVYDESGKEVRRDDVVRDLGVSTGKEVDDSLKQKGTLVSGENKR